MTPEQFDTLQILWDDGVGMTEIKRITGLADVYLDRYHDLWYDLSVPVTPSYNAVLNGVNL